MFARACLSSLSALVALGALLTGCPDETPGGDAGQTLADGGNGNGKGDGGTGPVGDGGSGTQGDGGVDPSGDAGAAEDGGLPPGDYTPPAGPYVVVSPVAADQSSERDVLIAPSGPFEVEVRVGHVDDVRTFGFELSWDPAVLEHVSRERIDTWLTSNGGSVIPLSDEVNAAEGSFLFAAGLAGMDAPVSTATSEAIYRITFDFVAGAAQTQIQVDLSQDGLVQDGATEPIPDVTTVPLTVRPN